MYMSLGHAKMKQMASRANTWGLDLGVVVVGMDIGRRSKFMGVRGFMRGHWVGVGRESGRLGVWLRDLGRRMGRADIDFSFSLALFYEWWERLWF
jgi:hypothetical protein